jgi:broad specificity phosphatase PhoE
VPTTILLVRHGETDWNRERRWQGHADPSLNALGREQAGALAETLAVDPPAAIWSSDLARARETAEIVAARLDLPVRLDQRLREVDVGEWSGLTRAELEVGHPDGLRRWLEGTGEGWQHGESYEHMQERVLEALHELAAAHAGERVLVVSHGGPIRAVQAAIDGIGVAESRRRRGPAENAVVLAVTVEGGVLRRLD